MIGNNHQSAPKHLRKAIQKFWCRVVQDYELQEHHIRILTCACEALDRATEARLAVQKAGAFFTNRHGAIKPHPGLAVERDNRALFSRLIRELALDSEMPTEAYSRPPKIAGRYK
jgi:phage terminase small subunit